MESSEKLYKVLCIGDPHFKTGNVKECEAMCNQIYKVIEQHNPDLIVVMGDVLDRHETIHVVPLTNSIKFLKRLSEYKKTYVLIGNHDRPNNNDYLSDFHPFVGIQSDNLILVDKVHVAEINGYKFLFVPYVYPGRFEEAVNTKKSEFGDIKHMNCIFAHQEFYSTKMGSIVSTKGDKWPKDNPFVISGHIHDYTRPQNNVVYVGTPLQHAFGDRDDKTISLFEFKPKLLSSNDSNNLINYPEEIRIDLGLIKRVIHKISCKDIITWVPPENYLIKLIIEGTSSEIKAMQKLDYIKQLNKRGIKIAYVTIDEIKAGATKQIKQEEMRLSYIQRLQQHVKSDPGMNYWFDYLFNKPM
jgi:DNA repair exonuclease SbcCD nuclease subunit